MAYDICMWEQDGPNGEAMVKSIRIKKVAQIPEILSYWKDNGGVVRITQERSEGAATFKTLWIKPGYVDPF